MDPKAKNNSHTPITEYVKVVRFIDSPNPKAESTAAKSNNVGNSKLYVK